jgi:hypothetical protein
MLRPSQKYFLEILRGMANPRLRALLLPLLFVFSPMFFPVSECSETKNGIAGETIAASARSLDTSLIIEDHTKRVSASAGSTTTKDTRTPDSLTGHNGILSTFPATDSHPINTKEMFRTLGALHKGMGIFTVAAGTIAVIAGASILDRQDILPFSLSLITIGGIAAGIGVWEIKVGWNLSKRP